MKDNYINYIELYAIELDPIREFYSKAFGWTFTDYGPTYTAFHDSGLEGGFEKVDRMGHGGALVVLYHQDLEAAKANVLNNGGEISKDIFTFPGGKRFQFMDPAGNELAVWSEVAE